jgi:hypothetical protein
MTGAGTSRFRALAIGWDVGGWLGNKQAVAVIGVRADGSWTHVGAPRRFSMREVLAHGELSVDQLLRIGWTDAPPSALDQCAVLVAIDAPLSFPEPFVRLIAGGALALPRLDQEIENVFAYRDCDRYVHRTYGKKPLSASFDRLGNNATLALALTSRWREHERFAMLPFDAPGDGRRTIIETYPALLKGRAGMVLDRSRVLLPASVATRSADADEQDAALCALVAAAQLGATTPALPPIVEPVSEHCGDGWIYAPSRAWIDAE